MRIMRQLFLSLLYIGAGFFVSSTPVAAQSPQDFDTSLSSEYLVKADGSAFITHTFTVTNKTAATFLSQYSLELHSTTTRNITAKASGSELTPQITQKANTTKVELSFTDQVVGEGKERTFSISYDTLDIGSVAGNVLEVQIPPMTANQQYTAQKIILKTPLKFGNAVRITPTVSERSLTNDLIITEFTEGTENGVSALFGTEQIFKMTLRYNLENNSSSPGLAQIALPPDTRYQRMQYISLDPSTQDLKVDADGNWLATYEVPANSTIPVYLTALAQVTLEPNARVPEATVLPSHTQSTKFWESSAKSITEKAPLGSNPQDLYNTVIETLSYAYPVAENLAPNRRLGAVEALANPDQAVCSEFTDTFIALARAAQIPARRLTGYAYTQNTTLRPLSLQSDILHAWPEFFNSETNRWQQVDPTWEDTTGGIDYFSQFDLNHLVFAINGVSSTTPYAAGSYKGSDLTTKDVEVSFAESFTPAEPQLTVELNPSEVSQIGVPGFYTLSITNPTGEAWYDIEAQLAVTDATVRSSLTTQNISVILPYQTLSWPVQFTNASWGGMQEVPVQLVVKDGQKTYYDQTPSVTSGPEFVSYLKDLNTILTVVAGCAIVTLAAGSILVFRRRR